MDYAALVAEETDEPVGSVAGTFSRTAMVVDTAGNSTTVTVTFTIDPTAGGVETLIEDWLAGDSGAIRSLGNHLDQLDLGECGGPLTAFKAGVAAQLKQGDLTPEQAELLSELADVICDVP